MADLGYIRSNVEGAWDVVNGRESGLSKLDLSADGFWRSFGVIVLILPFIVVASLGERSIVSALDAPPPAPTAGSLAWAFVVIVIDWIAFPIVMAVLARPLGFAQHYGRFIIARNWASFISAGIAAAVYLLYVPGILPAESAGYATLVVLIVWLRFAYKVARVGLDATWAVALPVVILDLLLSLLIQVTLGGL